MFTAIFTTLRGVKNSPLSPLRPVQEVDENCIFVERGTINKDKFYSNRHGGEL